MEAIYFMMGESFCQIIVRLAEYPPYGRDIQLVPAEGYSVAFGPLKILGFQPNILLKIEQYYLFWF